MNKKHLFFAALFLAALTFGFVGCENPDDNIDNDVKYRLEVNSNNAEMGTVVGSGTFKKGTEVTITAKPNYLYHLCAWSDCDTKDLIRKIVVNSDTVITAIFSDNPYLRVKSNNTSYGTVSGTGTYEIGSEVIITAKPKENYCFFSWSDCDSKELTRTVVVNTDSTIIANFAKKPKLVAKPNNASYGTVTGSGYYDVGTKVTITAATKGEHCYFNGWSDCSSKELTREVVIISDTTIIANFTADPYLNVESNNTSFGTVTGSGYYKSGTKVTITATPEPYRFFKSWSDTDTKDLTRTITITSDTTIIANFAAKHLLSMGSVKGDFFAISAEAAEMKMKDVTGYYLTGEEVVLELTIPFGFSFDYWDLRTDNKKSKAVYDNPATIVVDDDWIINARIKFAADTDTVSGSENGHNYVDLGLPSGLKWATCNVGAFHSKDKGYRFAWGEVEPKITYDWSTYKFMASGSTGWKGINKYTIDDEELSGNWYNSNGEFIGDNKNTLDPEDDAATVNMGGSWRMPTEDEIQELIDNCNWVYAHSPERSIGVSKINGNIIVFLKESDFTKVMDTYWSSSLSPYTSAAKYCSMRTYSISRDSRYKEKFVRGVTE